MDIKKLMDFFMWCTIINGGLLILWTLSWMLIPDLIFRFQTRWFPITREAYNVVFYCFVGLFKIMFLFFNVVPYVALLLMA